MEIELHYVIERMYNKLNYVLEYM